MSDGSEASTKDLRRIAHFLTDCADRAESGAWKSYHCHFTEFDRKWNHDHPVSDVIVIHPAPELPISPLSWLFVGTAVAIGVAILVHCGVLSVITMLLISLMLDVPITTKLSSWYARDGLWALGFVLALAVYGFWTSLDRRVTAEV